MKIPALLLGFSLLAAGARAFAPHPSVLTVQYHDQMLPVVRVISTDPVVLVDGQEKRIRTEPLYLVQRVADFSPLDRVELVRMSLGGMRFAIVANAEDAAETTTRDQPRFGTTYLEATLRSKRTLTQGFIVAVAYSAASFTPGSPEFNPAQIIVHALPELPAGQEVAVKFSAASLKETGQMHYFVQIFDATGAEVPVGKMEAAWQYYSLLERAQLQGVIAKYRAKFSGTNHAAVPAMMARPIFREGLTLPTTPVSAVITISAEGTVSEVSVRGTENPELLRSITEALSGWLFLPQLKAGQPVATKVQIPLKF